MSVIHARTTAEAREYMVLAMGDCDEVALERTGLSGTGDDLAVTYLARCSPSGDTREFTVTTDRAPDDADLLEFGHGPRPSELIDAGEWYAIFSRYMGMAQVAEERFLAGDQDQQTAQTFLSSYATARAAIAEILKFIAPGEQQPPRSAFWTAYGREIHDGYGDQLTRPVLEGVLRTADERLAVFYDAIDRASGEAGA